jgi:hypothetical protein
MKTAGGAKGSLYRPPLGSKKAGGLRPRMRSARGILSDEGGGGTKEDNQFSKSLILHSAHVYSVEESCGAPAPAIMQIVGNHLLELSLRLPPIQCHFICAEQCSTVSDQYSGILFGKSFGPIQLSPPTELILRPTLEKVRPNLAPCPIH